MNERNETAHAAAYDEGRSDTASPDSLAAPAGEYLARVPWEGVAPDPDALDAASFLAAL